MFPSAKDYLADSKAANAYCEHRLADAVEVTAKIVSLGLNREIVLYGHTITHTYTHPPIRSVWRIRPRGSEQFVRVNLAQLVAFILATNW